MLPSPPPAVLPQVSIFLMRDGTLISMFEHSGSRVTRPILHQVMEEHTLARDCQDASYLLNLLVDAIVDATYPLVDAYTDQVRALGPRLVDAYTDQVRVQPWAGGCIHGPGKALGTTWAARTRPADPL